MSSFPGGSAAECKVPVWKVGLGCRFYFGRINWAVVVVVVVPNVLGYICIAQRLGQLAFRNGKIGIFVFL